MKKLKALVTASLSKEGLQELREIMDVEYHDWQEQKRPYTQEELKKNVTGQGCYYRGNVRSAPRGYRIQ